MYTVNPELLSLARMRLEKIAVVPGGDPAAMGGGAPPMDPAAMGAAPPVDPAAMGGGAPMDPAMMGAVPPAPPAPAPAAPAAPAAPGQAGAQKLKPEQMMNMLDYRLYNMQQQLTAIMNALGVQVAPESLVLPPGSPGAPPAESALPGGPMAPPPQAAGAPPGPQAPGGPQPPPGPLDPSAPPADPAAMKGASANELHVKASAWSVLQRSLNKYAG
jgi:hypothetical protein